MSISIEPKQQISALNTIGQDPAVDIDSFLHLGHQNSNNYSSSRSVPSQFLPRLNKSQYTSMPFDIDHLVTLGKHTMDYRHSNILIPTIQTATKESFVPGLLSNESMDSLSSDDTTITGVDLLPKTPSETSLSLSPFNTSRPSSNTPIMDIDQLIQIGSNPDTSAPSNSHPVVSRRTLDIDQYFEQILSSEERKLDPETIEMDIDNLLSIPSHHTFPLSRKSRQFPLKHTSLYPLDIDNLIQIGTSTTPFLGELSSESEKLSHSTKSISQATQRKHSSPVATSGIRRTKSRFWGKCIGKLKKAFFV